MMDERDFRRPVEVVFCMGSSCFSRGNGKTLSFIQNYLKENGLENQVQLKGVLCQGKCQNGPNITINGALYQTTEPGVVIDLIRHHLAAGPQ
ncbi:MAG TPA: (2Fe-2S) ferredoxin domain-containing protein [Anaerohalosphaeraceae bacterium]|nr:(2Fe-2S) ferredoxin domain-containing protein [Anaerohalosphaeraceae bacterium]